MPRIETIKAREAPPPPKKLSKVASEIVAAINGLKKDGVLRLQPDPGKSMRGLKTSVGWITSGNNVKVESWTDEDQQFPYVRKAQ